MQDSKGSLPPAQRPSFHIQASSRQEAVVGDLEMAIRMQESELEEYSRSARHAQSQASTPFSPAR